VIEATTAMSKRIWIDGPSANNSLMAEVSYSVKEVLVNQSFFEIGGLQSRNYPRTATIARVSKKLPRLQEKLVFYNSIGYSNE
jgi:hypothetical protein